MEEHHHKTETAVKDVATDFDDFLDVLSVSLEAPLPDNSVLAEELKKTLSEFADSTPLLTPQAKSGGAEGDSLPVKKCAVMLLIYPKNNIPHIVLTQRQVYKGRFSGDLCFPGGKMEPEDLTLETTAFRETFEEIGIESAGVTVLSELSSLLIEKINLFVTPFVAVTETDLSSKFQPSEREVADIIELPLKDLLDEAFLGTATKSIGGDPLTVPGLFVDESRDRIVWGMTFQILMQLKYILKQQISS